MEVAALRTLYLFKAGPDQAVERFQASGDDPDLMYTAIMKRGKIDAQKPRSREEASVSKNYRKVLTELRAAFIAGQEERINELSEQLDELVREEQPDLDDAVEITDQARKEAPTCCSGSTPASSPPISRPTARISPTPGC